MDPRPPLPGPPFWYSGPLNPGTEDLFRTICALAWPYALYCATRYFRDTQAAYDLMDQAVANTERYYERHQGQRTPSQLAYRVVSVLKRLSKQQLSKRHEFPAGTLSDLDALSSHLTARSQAEQMAFINELFTKMSPRSRQITRWRLSGNTWRQIGEKLGRSHAAVRRTYRKELRALLFPGTDSSIEREASHQKKERQS